MNTNCHNCNQSFQCNLQCDSHCWCADYPAVSYFDGVESCFCHRCLTTHIANQLENFIELNSTNDIIKFAKQFKVKDLIENIDYTVNKGNIVFTKWFHLKRGYCCKNGCTNCPF